MLKFHFNKVAKLLCNFIEITLRYGCSLVNLQHIFRTLLYRNNSRGLLLKLCTTEVFLGACQTLSMKLFAKI